MTHIDFVREVALAIRAYAENGGDSQICDHLANLGAKIIRQRLCQRIKISSVNADVSVEQLSLSLIGGLFTKNPRGVSGLETALEDYMDLDDIDLFLRFQSVVVRAASQELFHRWKDTDQISSRIWRNMHHALKTNPDLILFPADNPRWVSLMEEVEIKSEMEPIDFSRLCRYTGEAVYETKGIGAVIIQVLIKITEDPLLIRAIQIEELFSAIREVYTESRASLQKRLQISEPENSLFSMSLEKASGNALEKVSTIIGKYDSLGKLPADIIDHFKNALYVIISDHSDGGICQSYYEYLKESWTKLEKADYRKYYRAKFEYLAETALQEFNNTMKDEYYE